MAPAPRPDPEAVAVQHPFRRPGRAARVHHDHRRLGVRLGDLEGGVVAGPHGLESLDVGPRIRGVDGDDVLEVGTVPSDRGDGVQHRHVDDDHARPAVGQAVLEGVRPEQHRQRQRGRPQLPAGQGVIGFAGFCGTTTATRSPRPTLRSARACATWFERSSSSANV